jgi:streptomycin 3"-adenylyltransferase
MALAVMPENVRAYVGQVDQLAQDMVGRQAVSTYVHGSLALGGFNPEVSDVDILVVVDNTPPLDTATLEQFGGVLIGMPSPGRELELSVVASAAARAPSPPWPFLLHVTTTAKNPKVIVGDHLSGDPDLLIHYAVVRAAGITISGRPPLEQIGPVDRSLVLSYLADELAWAQTHAGEAYGVLNAARAASFLDGGVILSKIDGGQRQLAAGGPADLLRRALEVQMGRTDDRKPTDAAVHFMRSVQARLVAAAQA